MACFPYIFYLLPVAGTTHTLNGSANFLLATLLNSEFWLKRLQNYNLTFSGPEQDWKPWQRCHKDVTVKLPIRYWNGTQHWPCWLSHNAFCACPSFTAHFRFRRVTKETRSAPWLRIFKLRAVVNLGRRNVKIQRETEFRCQYTFQQTTVL